jgi:hypothetical protein
MRAVRPPCSVQLVPEQLTSVQEPAEPCRKSQTGGGLDPQFGRCRAPHVPSSAILTLHRLQPWVVADLLCTPHHLYKQRGDRRLWIGTIVSCVVSALVGGGLVSFLQKPPMPDPPLLAATLSSELNPPDLQISV